MMAIRSFSRLGWGQVQAPAQYLLRIDDLCPTVDRARWRAVRDIMTQHALRPILAIVPANADKDLMRSPTDPDFWEDMRRWEARGAAIGLHGYRHLCCSPGRSLLGLHTHSEFAGVEIESQREWIQSGLTMLRAHALNPRVWVAPRHGFDRNTLLVLREAGVRIVSDGFARLPYTRRGFTWLPQQLWSPLEKEAGVWTICLHPNTITSADLERLRSFLKLNACRFTSVDCVVSEHAVHALHPIELIHERIASWRVRWRHKRARRNSRLGQA